MFTGKRVWVAWAAMAMALAASRSLAGESNGEDVEQAGYVAARRGPLASKPHKVTIWRGGTPTLATAQVRSDEEAEVPPMPPSAPDGEQWEGGLSHNAELDTPFADEPQSGGGNFGPAHAASCDCGGDPSCSTCGACSCLPPWWAHRTFFFGEYLYLHPSGVDMAHAIQQNGAGGAGTTPEGRVGVVDQAYNSAYRTGFGVALGPCASIQATYADFHSHNTDTLAAPDVSGGTVASLVFHPESDNTGSTASLVNAANDIDFRLADIEYRRLLAGGSRFTLNYAIGARYGRLQQDFLQIGDFAPPTGTIQTTTNIDFEGGGLRVGLDGMQRLGNTRFGVYGKGFLSLLFGRFDTDYLQFNVTTDSVQAASNWTDERVVPVLEYEAGLNFTSHSGRWRFSAGYYTAFWFNTIATPEYVQAVQNADFVGLGETIAFDGLVSRLEFRY